MNTDDAPLAYRPDIDGLRAMAVLSVVAYHVHAASAPGGFVGVDVFFVISGFLITGLLLRELRETGSISMVNFYARRIRRLWPAFALVTAVTLLLSTILLTPMGEQQQLAKSALAGLGFVSNVFFLSQTGGYFNRAAELMPLLHTWSLSVEEQFYLVCPALLLLAWRGAKRRRMPVLPTIGAILAVVLLASLVASIVTTQTAQSRAYYLMHLRAWELASGSLLTLALPWLRARRAANGALASWCGIGLVLLAVFGLDSTSAFPGPAAVIPVAGAVLIIAGGAMNARSIPTRLLCTSLMTGIGKISYSFYLWHWALLALFRAADLGVPMTTRDVLAGWVAAPLLAAATYHFLELPVREHRPGWFARPWPTVGAGAAISAAVACSAIALGLLASQNLRGQSQYAELWNAKSDAWLAPSRCHEDGAFEGLVDARKCSFGASIGGLTLVVWGDSHADQLMPAMVADSRAHGTRVLQRTRSACPPLTNAVPRPRSTGRNDETCAQFNHAVLSELLALSRQQPLGVVLAGRWTAYIEPRLASGAPSTHTLASRAGSQMQLQGGALLADDLHATLTSLQHAGIRTLLIDIVPELEMPAPECLAHRKADACSATTVAASHFRATAHEALARTAAEFPNSVRLWDPLPFICDASKCQARRSSQIVYRDTNHLTASFVAGLLPDMAPALQWLRQ